MKSDYTAEFDDWTQAINDLIQEYDKQISEEVQLAVHQVCLKILRYFLDSNNFQDQWQFGKAYPITCGQKATVRSLKFGVDFNFGFYLNSSVYHAH